MAGISWSAGRGAESIVLNGGYEDDVDYGDEVIYTGHGGNDRATGRQIANQELARGNLALARSCIEGLPVRVVRGSRGDPGFSPPYGYRYDGEYWVKRYWSEVGRSGFRVWRFRLLRQESSPAPWDIETREVAEQPGRTSSTVQRIVRNTIFTQSVKELHHHLCQICDVRLMTPAGPYAEGAHIRPLGRPHDGPDEPSNILCLCPNHHALFDAGGIVVDDNLEVWDAVSGEPIGSLRMVEGHDMSQGHLRYHRNLFKRVGVGDR